MEIFFITSLVSLVAVYPGFELFQNMAIKRGEIPPRGVHTWHGRQFLHWDAYIVQRNRDPLFFSALNGFAALALYSLGVSDSLLWAIGGTSVTSLALTYLWLTGVQRSHRENNFARWDASFTAPDARLTTWGRYHLIYFWFELSVIVLSLVYLVWQPVGLVPRTGIIVSLLGYAALMLYDIRYTGLYLGPLRGHRLKKKI